jgi:Fe2+ or Zn2+ uptake regulation protein
VYRTLESLSEWGIITPVRRPHGAAFFHLSPTHQHVVCEVCGRIEDVPSSEFDELVDRLRDHHDFELDVHQTALVGRCNLHTGTNGHAHRGRVTGSA